MEKSADAKGKRLQDSGLRFQVSGFRNRASGRLDTLRLSRNTPFDKLRTSGDLSVGQTGLEPDA
jgi:hypothetical protein